MKRGLATSIQLAAILALTFAVYVPSLDNDFTNWDDTQYVLGNPHVARPDLGVILTTPIAANYHPLTILSLAANYRISGLHPGSYHALNLLLHLANTALVFAFVWMLSGGRRWTTIVTSLIFGIHPMHVESVAWISGRKDVLYAFFYLAGLIAYLQYLQRGRWWWWVATTVAFVGSLASKPAAVVFPLALLAIDWYRRRAWSPRLLLEKSAWFAAAIAAGVLTVRAQEAGGALEKQWDPLTRVLSATYGLVMYVVKLVVPTHLSAIYPVPNVGGRGPGIEFYLAFVAAAVGFPLALYLLRRHRPALFGLAFYFVNIVLVLQFVTVGKAVMADRYTYLPYIGLAFALAWPLDDTAAGSRYDVAWRRALAAGALLLLPVCLVGTWQRCDVWQNSESLWNDTIRKDPDRSVDAYVNRGYYYQTTTKEYGKALADYDKALAIDPTVAYAWNNRGMLLGDLGEGDSAIACFDRAIALRPGYEQAWNNRGGVKLKQGDLAGGIADVSRAIELSPRFRDAYANRAIGYSLAGDHERAVEEGRRVIAFAPGDPSNYLYYGLVGTSLLALKKDREAIASLDEALRLAPAGEPRRGGFHLARSQAWAAVGDRTRALEDAREAMRLDPSIGAAFRKSVGDEPR
ncbi:MAG TPA: tetratricopeptide repeat protein [Candidatus Eisenbacteria bacterium]|nr:tetratricopeptide repeat protein [Candidatus Eisenbacteria bacterium]